MVQLQNTTPLLNIPLSLRRRSHRLAHAGTWSLSHVQAYSSNSTRFSTVGTERTTDGRIASWDYLSLRLRLHWEVEAQWAERESKLRRYEQKQIPLYRLLNTRYSNTWYTGNFCGTTTWCVNYTYYHSIAQTCTVCSPVYVNHVYFFQIIL